MFNPNYRQPQDPTPVQQDTGGGPPRDRLPSFETMESSGSLHYVAPKSSNPSPQLSKVSHDKLNKVNPQNLPYDQRRKLMKLRQQQAQKDPSPPQPQRPELGYMHQQQPTTPQGYYAGGVPMMSPQSPYGYPYGMNPHPQMHLPQGSFPTPPGARLSPYRSPRHDPNRPPPNAKQGPPRNRQYAPQQPHLVPQQGQVMPHQLPPSGLSRPMPPTLRDNRQYVNAMEPHDLEPALPRLRPRAQIYQQDQNLGGPSPPPPPPPPPPSMPPNHVRAES